MDESNRRTYSAALKTRPDSQLLLRQLGTALGSSRHRWCKRVSLVSTDMLSRPYANLQIKVDRVSLSLCRVWRKSCNEEKQLAELQKRKQYQAPPMFQHERQKEPRNFGINSGLDITIMGGELLCKVAAVAKLQKRDLVTTTTDRSSCMGGWTSLSRLLGGCSPRLCTPRWQPLLYYQRGCVDS